MRRLRPWSILLLPLLFVPGTTTAAQRTTGEIIQGVEDSYRRLHRQVSRLTDAQLVDHDGFAAAIIAGNSYGHYREHLPDIGGPGDREAATDR